MDATEIRAHLEGYFSGVELEEAVEEAVVRLTQADEDALEEKLGAAGWVALNCQRPWYLPAYTNTRQVLGSRRTVIYVDHAHLQWWWHEGHVSPPSGTAFETYFYAFGPDGWQEQQKGGDSD